MKLLNFPVAATLALATLATPLCASAAELASGKAAFTPCAACHQIGPDARNAFGPQLNGLIGRPAGSVAGYGYSKAMKNAKIVWNEQTLAAFIRSPDRTVPGTKMRFYSLGYDDRKIADLLAYLRTFPVAGETK